MKEYKKWKWIYIYNYRDNYQFNNINKNKFENDITSNSFPPSKGLKPYFN